MGIPKFTKDLSVIQKLSDLPNATDGLTAAELKAKFDEAGLAIQNWINNDLLPAMKAENLPFAASSQLNAADVQSAIELVFEQVRGASSGTITNGSVTKEKLAQELLERVFGGRVWLCLDKPSANDGPQAELPVGQLWLRPGFTVENAAGDDWQTSACTMTVGENKVTVTGDNTYSQADATMYLPDMGQDGDRVYVLFGIKDKDSEMTSLTVCLNEGEEESASQTIHQAELANGALSVRFRATWPSTSLANGSYTIENLAVVNIDQIMRQTSDCREFADWGNYLQGLLPIVDSCYSPRELYVQTAAGVWKQLDHEVFPVDRGGTGVESLAQGEMLYGSGNGRMEKLETADENNSLMMFSNGVPVWATADEVKARINLDRIEEGSYVGTGEARTITLPVKPKMLFIGNDMENAVFLMNGMENSGTYSGKVRAPVGGTQSISYTASVRLSDTGLQFLIEEKYVDAEWVSGDVYGHCNKKDRQYHWVALY